METIDHFVEFDKYCKTCKFRDKNDKKGEEPCNDYLDNQINQNSRKRGNYKENTKEIERLDKEKKKKKGEEPCNECLDNPINQDSRKPVNYKEDPDEIERLEKEEKKKLEDNK